MKNNPIEIALKIDNLQQLEDLDISHSGYSHNNDFTVYYDRIYQNAINRYVTDPVQRIYYGSEFCELRIPTYSEISSVFNAAYELGLSITFLTPPVTAYGIEKIKRIFPLLQRYHCEVSINDYGVLKLLHSLSFEGEIISGRILDKSYHDGRMNSVQLNSYTNEYGNIYLRSPAVSAHQYQELLLGYGIHRYDIDIPLFGIDLSTKLRQTHFSAFLPYGYVTTGRNCMMRNYGRENYSGFNLTDYKCARKCKEYDQLMEQPISSIQMNSDGTRRRNMYMMRKGNTIYYATAILKHEEQQFDRIVIQKTLML